MSKNLYKRGGVWWGRISVAGKEFRESLRTGDRDEAKEALAEFRRGHKRNDSFKGTRLTWKEGAGNYVTTVLPSLRPNTAKRYLVSLAQVEEHLQQYYLHEIGPRQISDLIAARRRQKITNATINRDLTAVSRVLAAGLGKEANDHNAAKDYDRSLNREHRDPIELPTWEEVAAAIAKAPTPLWAQIMDFASKSGMRENEILTLEKPRVDLKRNAITLTRTKGGRLRVVPLSGPLLEECPDILRAAMTRGERFVFGHKGDDTLKNFPSRYAAWRRKEEVSFRFHDLRHLFAVTYLHKGGNLYDLQRILGHRSIKTTEEYLDYLTPAERRKALSGNAHFPAQP